MNLMSLSIEPARAADYPLFAALFPLLVVPDPPPSALHFESGMLPRVLVARDGDEGVGYAFWQVYGELAHVLNVVVAEAARGRGVGRALMEGVRRACRREGCTRWYLNVKQDNQPAIALYRRCGMLPDGEVWTLRLPWSAVAALPSEGEGLAPYAPGPEEDAELSSWPGVTPARIAVLRARPGVVLRALREGGRPAAFASFDPSRPGINPLRLARPTLLRPLLVSLREAGRGHDHLVIVVERDVATRDLLQGAGGDLLYALLQMAGPLDAVGEAL
jgi:GNAT superfamily N-acetyltransferase